MYKVVHKSAGVVIVESVPIPEEGPLVEFVELELNPTSNPVIIQELAATTSAVITFRVFWVGVSSDWIVVWRVLPNGRN